MIIAGFWLLVVLAVLLIWRLSAVHVAFIRSALAQAPSACGMGPGP